MYLDRAGRAVVHELTIGDGPVGRAGTRERLPRRVQSHDRRGERDAEAAANAFVLDHLDGHPATRIDAAGLLEHRLEVLQRERRLSIPLFDAPPRVAEAEPVLAELGPDEE